MRKYKNRKSQRDRIDDANSDAPEEDTASANSSSTLNREWVDGVCIVENSYMPWYKTIFLRMSVEMLKCS